MSAIGWALLVPAAAAALFVLAELLARGYLARHGRWCVWSPHLRLHHELDRDALPMLEPVVRWEVNAAGERGGPLPRSREGLFRVLAGGGSTTECWFLDQPSTWPAILEELLSRPTALERLGARRVHVGNVARSVTTVQDVHEIFRRILPSAGRVDAVVLLVGASELVKWTQLGAPAEWPPTPPDPTRIFDLHPLGPFGWAPSRLALRRLLAPLWRRWRRPVHRRSGVGKRLIELRRMRAEAPHIVRELPDPSGMLANYEHHLTRLLRLLRERVPLVVFAPNPWFSKDWTDEERALFWNFGAGRPYEQHLDTYYSPEAMDEAMRRITEVGLRVARREGVVVVEPQREVACTTENYYDFLHHTPAGNRRVAEVFARGLLAAVERARRPREQAHRDVSG